MKKAFLGFVTVLCSTLSFANSAVDTSQHPFLDEPASLEVWQERERLSQRNPHLQQDVAIRYGAILEERGATKMAWHVYRRAEMAGSISAKERRQRIGEQAPQTKPHVLVLAPWGGSQRFMGEETRRGIEIAIAEGHLDTNRTPIIRVDVQVGLAELFFRLETLTDSVTVAGVVGPLTSQNAAAVLSWLSQRQPGIPVVLPTATDAQLVQLHPGAIQLNHSPLEQAEELAQFASQCKAWKRIAVVAPKNEYGSGMAERFKSRGMELGLQVEILASYPEKQVDFGSFVKQWKLQENKWDAVFNPASTAEEAASFARQMKYHRVRLPLLGTGGWAGQEFLELVGRDAENGFAALPSLEMGDRLNFLKNYRQRFGKGGDDRIAALTHDAILVLQQRQLSSNGQNVVGQKILGASGMVKIDFKGQNEAMGIAAWKSGAWVVPECVNPKAKN